MVQSKNERVKEKRNHHNLSQPLCCDLDIKVNTQEAGIAQ